MCKYCEKSETIKEKNFDITIVNSCLVVGNECSCGYDRARFNINYCFKCRKEAERVIEIIKDILLTIVLITGSLCVIMLLLCALYRCFCIFLDHMKNANVLRKCMMIYIKRKRPDIKLELEQIDIKRQGIHLKKEVKHDRL